LCGGERCSGLHAPRCVLLFQGLEPDRRGEEMELPIGSACTETMRPTWLVSRRGIVVCWIRHGALPPATVDPRFIGTPRRVLVLRGSRVGGGRMIGTASPSTRTRGGFGTSFVGNFFVMGEDERCLGS
jgi:hypothetical protein